MNLSMDNNSLSTEQQQPNRQNLNLLLLHQMYQPLVSGKSKSLYQKRGVTTFPKSIDIFIGQIISCCDCVE